MKTAISLFSGCGGMDIGVSQAGFKILSCVEIDRHACSSLRLNHSFQNNPPLIYEDDIRNLDPLEIISLAKGNIMNIDLLFGGPPCQAFSQIGKQKSLADERGLLLFEIIRFAKEILPRAILIEQVKGLLSAKNNSGKRGGVFESFLDELSVLGYISKWKIIRAVDYGVAQLRERLFIVATLGHNGFSFPSPTHAKNPAQLFPLKPWLTVGDVISDLPSPVIKGKGEIPQNSHFDATPARDRERIHGVPEGCSLSSQTHLPLSQIRNLTKKDTTKFLRVHRNKPANTLRGGEIFFHPTEDRYLTPREYMRIHGYPDTYFLKGPIRGRTGTVRDLDQHRQIGNSVPPPLAYVIAKNIIDLLDA